MLPMRTYKAKKPIYDEIENVQELCRLCLKKAEDGVTIYKDGQDVCAAVATRIMICIGLEMKYDQFLPNMICKSCHEELEKHYKFRRKCQMSYQKLKHHILAIKLKQQNVKMDLPFENIPTTGAIEDGDTGIMKCDEIFLENLDTENFKSDEKLLPNSSAENMKNNENMVLQSDTENMKHDEKLLLHSDAKNINNNEKLIQHSDIDNMKSDEKLLLHLNAKNRKNNEKLLHHSDTENMKHDEKLLLESKEISHVVENISEKPVEIEEIRPVEVEEVQLPLQSVVNPDISTFLSTILTELGILSRENGLLQHQGISTFELETGNLEQLVMELVEEDDASGVSGAEEQTSKESADPEDMVIEIKHFSVGPRSGKSGRAWCSECGRAFSSGSALARHARVHSGARPHVCAACGAAFAQKAVLHRHMLVHLDVRPHRCGECSKSFTQRAALEAHARSHAAPHARPLALHRCSACDKVFLYASGLSRHMVTHNGRVFECSSCNKRFRDKSSLARHRRNVCRKVPRGADQLATEGRTRPDED